MDSFLFLNYGLVEPAPRDSRVAALAFPGESPSPCQLREHLRDPHCVIAGGEAAGGLGDPAQPENVEDGGAACFAEV